MSDSESENGSKTDLKPNKYGVFNMPKKAKYRQRAHMNPFNELTIQCPHGPSCVNWAQLFPLELKENTTEEEYAKENAKICINTPEYPFKFDNENYTPKATSNVPDGFFKAPHINIGDFGCGYGGLLENMSSSLKTGELALGLEIRDKVTNYVGERIRALRLNSHNKEYNNIAVLRANTMKMQLNLFYKGQFEKLFFCFADPHFKKVNHRKRIINKYLLNEYSYLLKPKGKLYIITDVKELFDWERRVLGQNPCFKEISSKEEVDKDPFTQFMKNTNEARKVIKSKGEMYYSIYERVEPKIQTLDEVYECLLYSEE